MERLKRFENPKFMGCLNCGSIADTVLDDNTIIYGEYEFVFIGDEIYRKNIKVKDIEANELDVLWIESAFHSEKYQLQDGKWYLVWQGMGYA